MPEPSRPRVGNRFVYWPLKILVGVTEPGSVGVVEHHGRKYAVTRASDVLADNRTDAVLASQSSGPRVLLLHCGPADSAAHARAMRLAFGSALERKSAG